MTRVVLLACVPEFSPLATPGCKSGRSRKSPGNRSRGAPKGIRVAARVRLSGPTRGRPRGAPPRRGRAVARPAATTCRNGRRCRVSRHLRERLVRSRFHRSFSTHLFYFYFLYHADIISKLTLLVHTKDSLLDTSQLPLLPLYKDGRTNADLFQLLSHFGLEAS